MLDTSAYSALREGHEPVTAHVELASRVYVNAIVLGELRTGFLAGNRLQSNEEKLSDFLAMDGVEIAPMGEETARRYALIRNHLKKTGRPIPTNDIWIAATAFEYGLRLVTLDKHFERVEHVALDRFNW